MRLARRPSRLLRVLPNALFDRAFAGVPHAIQYALKANSNLAVLRLFSNLGAAFDLVSGGEIRRVLAALPKALVAQERILKLDTAVAGAATPATTA